MIRAFARQLMLAVPAFLLPLLPQSSAIAQPRIHGVYGETVRIRDYDAETEVFRAHVEVLLPPTYAVSKRPKLPIPGMYAWKFSFGEDRLLTFVFRTDSAISATSDRSVIRASSLHQCKSEQQWILDCDMPVRASARLGKGGLIIDITDSVVVSKIRAAKPNVLLRQLIEPGGRFTVDETGIKHR